MTASENTTVKTKRELADWLGGHSGGANAAISLGAASGVSLFAGTATTQSKNGKVSVKIERGGTPTVIKNANCVGYVDRGMRVYVLIVDGTFLVLGSAGSGDAVATIGFKAGEEAGEAKGIAAQAQTAATAAGTAAQEAKADASAASSLAATANTAATAAGTAAQEAKTYAQNTVKPIADEAKALADSTASYFWKDNAGSHTSSFKQENSATATGYEAVTSAASGAAGMLINRVASGVRSLLASFTQSGMGLYDGTGKSLASYAAGGFRVGADDAMNVNATASAIQLRTGTKTGVSLTSSSLNFYDVSEDGHSYNSASFSKDSSRIGRVGNAGDRKSNVYVGVVDPTAATPENIIAMRTGERNNAEFHDDRISFFDTAGTETAQFAADSMRIGKTATGKNNVLINDTAAFFRSGTANIAQFNADGITFWQGGGNIATYAYDSWRIGRTGTSSAPRPNLYAGLVDPSDPTSEVVMQFRRYNKVRAQLDAEKMAFYDQNSNETAVFAADSARIGRIASGIKNIVLNADGIYLRQNTVNLATLTNDAMTLGRTGSGYGNVVVNTSGLAVRSGQTELATFGADTIDLGKNSSNSVIKLCGGYGEIKVTTNSSLSFLDISSAYNISMTSENQVFLCASNPRSVTGNVSILLDEMFGGIYMQAGTGTRGRFDVTNDGIKIHDQMLADFVIARGTNDFWKWEMWYSGKAECWGKTASASNVSITTAWGAIYEADSLRRDYFPGGNSSYPFSVAIDGTTYTKLFNSAPDICMCEWLPGSGGGDVLSVEKSADAVQSSTQTCGVRLTRATSGTVSGRYQYHAIGRWKA